MGSAAEMTGGADQAAARLPARHGVRVRPVVRRPSAPSSRRSPARRSAATSPTRSGKPLEDERHSSGSAMRSAHASPIRSGQPDRRQAAADPGARPAGDLRLRRRLRLRHHGDYVRFGQMLLNGGSLDGQQSPQPEAFVQLMTSNHLGAGIQNRVAAVEPHRDGYGFGLGVAVRLQPGLAAVPEARASTAGTAPTARASSSTRRSSSSSPSARRRRATSASTTASRCRTWSTAR